jgi:uncharacterized membrane protein YdbT with pleckstrin-like domain
MPFPRGLLTKDETLVLELRPHPVMLAIPAVVLALTIALYGWLVAILPTGSMHTVLFWVVTVGGLVVLVLYPARRVIAWWTSYFVVTTDRVIHRAGLIAKDSMEIPLEAINDVRFHQSIFERMIGSGDLIIESAGTRGSETFEDIRHPETVQKTIYEQGELNQKRMAMGSAAAVIEAGAAVAQPTTPPSQPAAPASATDELAKLADLRDRGALTEEEFQAQKAKLLGGPGGVSGRAGR